MIKVVCEVREYPDSSQEYATLIVRNHWTDDKKVVLELGGNKYTFIASDLKEAISNAQKTNRWG